MSVEWRPGEGIRGWLALVLEAECPRQTRCAVAGGVLTWRRQPDPGPDVVAAEGLIRLLGGSCWRAVTPTTTRVEIRIPATGPATVLALGGPGFAERLRPLFEGHGVVIVAAEGLGAALGALAQSRPPRGTPRRVVVEAAALGAWAERFPEIVGSDPSLADVLCLLVVDGAGGVRAETWAGYTAVLAEPLTPEAVAAALAAPGAGSDRGLPPASAPGTEPDDP